MAQTHKMTVQELQTSDGTVSLTLSIRCLYTSDTEGKKNKTYEEAAKELRLNVLRNPMPTPVQIADFVQGEIKVLQAEAEKSAAKTGKK